MSQDDRIIDHDLVGSNADRRAIFVDCCGIVEVELSVEGVYEEPGFRETGEECPWELTAFSVAQAIGHNQVKQKDA